MNGTQKIVGLGIFCSNLGILAALLSHVLFLFVLAFEYQGIMVQVIFLFKRQH